MVSTVSVIGMVVSFTLCFIVPIAVCIGYSIRNKEKKVWYACLLGAAGFFVPQAIIRLPVLQLLSQKEAVLLFSQNHTFLYFFLLAFTAALFELAGRYAAAVCMKKDLSYEKGIAAGLAHGGMEAVILIGFSYINNIIYAVLINTGHFDLLYRNIPDESVIALLDQIKTAMIETPAYLFYLASLERFLTIICHTAFSLAVCYFVWKGKPLIGAVICLVLHTILDFAGPLLMTGGKTPEAAAAPAIPDPASLIPVYAFLTVFAIGAVIIIRTIKKKWKTGRTENPFISAPET